MSRLSISEGFDIFVNRLRYLKYYLFAITVVPLLTFLTSFLYLASKNDTLRFIITSSVKYGLLNLRDYFFGNLIKYKKGMEYYYYQDIYHKYFYLLFHTHQFYWSLAIAALSTVLIFFVVKAFTKSLSDKKVVRGTKVGNLGTVSNPKKFISPQDEVKHTMIIGTTGSGKTQLMYRLSRPTLYSCKNIFFDIKGDILPAYLRKGIDVIINPLDIRSSRWNFLKEVEDISDIDTLAESFISPDAGGFIDSKSDYFKRNAKFILSFLFKELYENGIVENDKIREVIIKEVFYKSDSGLISDLINNLNVGSNVSLADTLSTLRVNLDFVSILGFEPKVNPEFSIKDWLISDDNTNIFITTKMDKSTLTRGFNTAFLSMLLLKISSLPDVKNGEVRIRIWIDELANLSRIPHLAETLSFVRSKGVAIYLSTQSLEGLKRSYKEHEIKDILNNCNNLFCFSANDEYTASIISKLIGEQQVDIAFKNSFSTPKATNIDGISITHSRHIEYAVLPSEVTALKDLEFYAKLKRRWYRGKLKPIQVEKKDGIEFFVENKACKQISKRVSKDENSRLKTKEDLNPPSDGGLNIGKAEKNKGKL